MDEILKSFKQTGYLHHAYLCVGERAVVVPEVQRLAEVVLGGPVLGNPDWEMSHFTSFGIDDSRALRAKQARRPFGTRQVFVCSIEAMTLEAQNGLLKTFEEPTDATHFFLIAPTAEIFLPTLRSRLVVVNYSSTDIAAPKSKLAKLAEDFIAATPAKRLTLVGKILEASDPHTGGEGKTYVTNFLNEVEKAWHTEKGATMPLAFTDLWQVKEQLAQTGSAPKLLLEHLATVLPVC